MIDGSAPPATERRVVSYISGVRMCARVFVSFVQLFFRYLDGTFFWSFECDVQHWRCAVKVRIYKNRGLDGALKGSTGWS